MNTPLRMQVPVVPRTLVLNDFGDNAKLEIHVSITKRLRARLWLAKQLMRLVAALLHCSLEWVEE